VDAVAGPAEPERTPLARRLTRVAAWVGGAAILILVLDLLGIPVSDWIGKLFDKVGEVPAWAIVAVVLVSWVFGWTGGKELIESSYREAKTRSREMRARRR
jgi:hypothetical protein